MEINWRYTELSDTLENPSLDIKQTFVMLSPRINSKYFVFFEQIFAELHTGELGNQRNWKQRDSKWMQNSYYIALIALVQSFLYLASCGMAPVIHLVHLPVSSACRWPGNLWDLQLWLSNQGTQTSVCKPGETDSWQERRQLLRICCFTFKHYEFCLPVSRAKCSSRLNATASHKQEVKSEKGRELKDAKLIIILKNGGSPLK